MSETEKNKGDIFGIGPYGETIKCGVESAVQFLEALCLPAAEEFGLYLRDKVHRWRLKNTLAIIQEAKQILEKRSNPESLHAHPRIVIKVIQEGSCIDDSDLQKMWAGLLASSCTKDGTDETNLIFVNILCQISSVQARIINYLTPESMRRFHAHLPNCNPITVGKSKLHEVAGLTDQAVLERELNHLGSLGLISWQTIRNVGEETRYIIRIEDVTLRLCARCNGYEFYVDWARLYDVSENNKQPNKNM